MKVLIIGSGGREHALAWKIAKSERVSKIFCAPGNAGTSEVGENVNIKIDDLSGLLDFAKREKIDLTCVGPEIPLVMGITDLFIANGLKIFGPSKDAALLEGSKIYAKRIMKKYAVPTADFEEFIDPKKACEYAESKGLPLVVKADGLCAGKGVSVCRTLEEAKRAITDALVKGLFGDAGKRIIVEDCLEGEEASILVITDGKNIVPLASSQDHKRIFDQDKGPNTGGMGAYSPAPVITKTLFDKIMNEVIHPVISGMEKEGNPYKGVLYAGIMVTDKGPQVLEFNVRFGDPETQAMLPRMKSDLVDLMECSISNRILEKAIKWDERTCVSVVLASRGYPGTYEKGK
ncbi:MAG: phosphoribosylamine--glycine ligase, partial [Candidatus Omnitrophica bacterium]|nr:phosphoribosylamine--glycine ligase [Candidatus Omnitrophota bacterium]